MLKIFVIFTSFFLFAGFLFFPSVIDASSTDGTVDSEYKYAWGENVGWINFGTSEGNIHITDTSLSGYAWGENVGWISLNCANDDSCASADFKILNNSEGILSGYAWGENVGWINFAPTNGGVIVNSQGEFSGYAWGENVGWISFSCANTNSCNTIDYKIKTDWRPSSARYTERSGPTLQELRDLQSDAQIEEVEEVEEVEDVEEDEENIEETTEKTTIENNQEENIALPIDFLGFGGEQATNNKIIHLVKTTKSPAVYLVHEQKQWVIPHVSVFNSWGYNFDSVKTITVEKFNTYVNQGNLPFRNGLLVRSNVLDKPAVYFVEDEKLRPFISGEIFINLGYQWSQINWIPDSLLNQYRKGKTISSKAIHFQGSLIKYPNESSVYLINNGLKRPIYSGTTFMKYGFNWDDVITIPKEEIYLSGKTIF